VALHLVSRTLLPVISPRRLRDVVAVVAAVAALSSCALGERPYFEATPTAAGSMSGDPAIDAVLGRLDQVSSAVFTAGYRTVLVFDGTMSEVVTTQVDPTTRSTTVNDVRYITEPAGNRTCAVSTAQCSPTIDAARTSNTGVTPDFVFGDVAKRLRRDAISRIGPTSASTADIAGQRATCVDVPVAGGVKVYCALDDGVLARLVSGDVTAELTAYQPSSDPTLFTP
jgi:hypothetical protein